MRAYNVQAPPGAPGRAHDQCARTRYALNRSERTVRQLTASGKQNAQHNRRYAHGTAVSAWGIEMLNEVWQTHGKRVERQVVKENCVQTVALVGGMRQRGSLTLPHRAEWR